MIKIIDRILDCKWVWITMGILGVPLFISVCVLDRQTRPMEYWEEIHRSVHTICFWIYMGLCIVLASSLIARDTGQNTYVRALVMVLVIVPACGIIFLLDSGRRIKARYHMEREKSILQDVQRADGSQK